jgi:hypothetical protein
MKRLLIIIVFVLGSTALFAQDQDQDRLIVDGDVLQIRDRDQIRLQDKIILTDGTTVNPDGTFQKRIVCVCVNGECLDMNGVKYSNEYQYRSKIKQENKILPKAR